VTAQTASNANSAESVAIPTSLASKDGTPIAYERIGNGPALILIDGALGFRSFGSSTHLARLLAPRLTVFAYDRRGRGDSGDTPPVALDREIEDIEALINRAGGRASLYGISSGGALALEAAAALGDRVDRLALYEIPYDDTDGGVSAWRGYRTELGELLGAGRPGDAAELFMRLVGASDEGVARMRAQPWWATFEAVAPTLAYDAAALGVDRTVPIQRAGSVTAPTLVMDGSASLDHMPFMRASAVTLCEAIPNAEHRVVEGQAHEIDVQVLAPILAEFFGRA
jgi:pimeloyl-ACP methyl ester carboxylesterase